MNFNYLGDDKTRKAITKMREKERKCNVKSMERKEKGRRGKEMKK